MNTLYSVQSNRSNSEDQHYFFCSSAKIQKYLDFLNSKKYDELDGHAFYAEKIIDSCIYELESNDQTKSNSTSSFEELVEISEEFCDFINKD